ncbi:MAG: phospholipid carrier-dependent glycosyltransferase, partial [Calditrichaeota bacterium]
MNIENLRKFFQERNNSLIIIGLFMAALLPRVVGLGIFITADEPLWMTRSILFAEALLTGQLADMLQTGHPGVTTMWTGSLGLLLGYWQQNTATFLDFIRALPHTPDRVDIRLLPLVRLPTVFLAAVCVVLLYHWGRLLLGRRVALIAALLLAFDPLFLAHSRVLHHDALATIFISLSLLALLNYGLSDTPHPRFFLSASGILAGLALLSKGTSLVLIGFAGLFFIWLWFTQRRSAWDMVKAVGSWLVLTIITFVLLWPAMWVVPGQVMREVFGWIITSTDVGEVGNTIAPAWTGRLPKLGILFYPVNWLLKSTPLSIIGMVGLIGWWRGPARRPHRLVVGWLGIFTLLFTVMLTVGDKRDGRYLLPVYPPLCLLAASGLDWLGQSLSSRIRLPRQTQQIGLATLLILLLLAFSLPWYPYYHSYYNPLIGGNRLAPKLIKVGWGEGMEQVAAYLNQQENAQSLVVATSYASTLLPFFVGRAVKHHQVAPSDYVLNYIRQVQNGYPFPEYWQYYQPRPPLMTVHEDGLDYAWLYPGPHINIVRNAQFGAGLTLLGFVLDANAAQPGHPSVLTLLWRISPEDPTLVRTTIHVEVQDETGRAWVKANGPVLDPAGPSPVEGHYRLDIPVDMPRGDYALWVSIGDVSRRVGTIPVRVLQKPPVQIPASTNFGNLITFGGADIAIASNRTLQIKL